ncbi:MAG: LysM peptidoglycan-binding domain-containing protein [Bacteroidia bacterium]
MPLFLQNHDYFSISLFKARSPKTEARTFLAPILIMLLFLVSGTGAQAQLGTKNLKLGIGMLTTMYQGDLSMDESGSVRVYPGANLSIQSQRIRRIQLQLNAGFGRFADQYDNGMPAAPEGVQPVSFVETSYFYGDLRLRLTPFPWHRIRPYGSVGAGFLIFSPKDLNGKFLSDAILTRPPGENYNTSVPQLPLSLGIQTELTGLLGAGIEYTYRFTPTDYLDNVGSLGNHDGYDRLHNVTFSLYFNFSGRRGRPNLPSKPEGMNVLATLRAAAADSLLIVWNEVEVPETPVKTVTETAVASAANAEKKRQTAAELEAARLKKLTAMCEEAIRNGDVLYFLPESFDTYASLYERFSVPASIVQSLNGLEGQENLPLNTSLVLPDLRKYLTDDAEAARAAAEAAHWQAMELEALKESRYIYYQIKKDDSLESIAERFKTRISTVKKLNALQSEKLYVGTYLRLPNLGIPVNQ